MKGNIFWIILVIVVGGYGGYAINSHFEKKAKSEAELAKAERIENETRTAMSKMVSRTNAVEDWEKPLGESFRSELILTIELEKLWLQQRPILFIGRVRDISTLNQSQYVILVERSPYDRLNTSFNTKFQLSLISSKDRIDSFLKDHPRLSDNFGLTDGVAVVARINSIKTTQYLSCEDGEDKDVKIGNGELVDILYTGDMRF